MAKRKKGRSSNKPIGLTFKERAFATERMMAAAQANDRASVLCVEKRMSKTPSIREMFSIAVSFSLSLISVEQSLKLLLLIRFTNAVTTSKHLRSTHEIFELYRTIKQQGRRSEALLGDIAHRMNVFGKANEIGSISERELEKCLGQHNSSYTNLRYFGLQKNFRKNETNWKILPRDRHIMWCLAHALIEINIDEITKCGTGILRQMSKVPESREKDKTMKYLNS